MYRFTGKELDPETGLYYYGARYYDPVLSKWIAADPIIDEYLPNLLDKRQAQKEWKPEADLPGMGGAFNPKNLELYAYTHSNPVRLTDPTGTDPVDENGNTNQVLRCHVNPHNDRQENLIQALIIGAPLVAFAAMIAGPEIATASLAAAVRYPAATLAATEITAAMAGIQGSNFMAPRLFSNSKGLLTNGRYLLDEAGMIPHMTGSLTAGKSQFLFRIDARKAVLDAAAYADEAGLWIGNKAKVLTNAPVGVSARTGELTNWLNVYRTNTGFVHGAPGGVR
jgi:hypothetical protein